MNRLLLILTLLVFILTSCGDEGHVHDAVVISRTQGNAIDTVKKKH